MFLTTGMTKTKRIIYYNNKVRLLKEKIKNLEYHLWVFKGLISNTEYLNIYNNFSIEKVKDNIKSLEFRIQNYKQIEDKYSEKIFNLEYNPFKPSINEPIIEETTEEIKEEPIEETKEETKEEPMEEIINTEEPLIIKNPKKDFIIQFHYDYKDNLYIEFLEFKDLLCYTFQFKSKNKIYNYLKDELDKLNFNYLCSKNGTKYIIKILDDLE